MRKIWRKVRQIWRNAKDPLNKLWRYAKKPRKPERRHKRWKVLKKWADRKRKQAPPRSEKRRKWKERRDIYARKAKQTKPKPAGIPSGTGPWGGSQSICDNEVAPVFAKFGVPITSRKRPATHPLSKSNPGSDHNEANTTAYALDGGTFNGAPVAHAVAKALGITGYSTGNYNSYFITRAGRRYRVQILWAVPGHFNHVHVGVRLV